MKKTTQFFFVLVAFFAATLYITKPFLKKLDDYRKMQTEPLPSILERDLSMPDVSRDSKTNSNLGAMEKKSKLETKSTEKITNKPTIKSTTMPTTKLTTNPTTKPMTKPTTEPTTESKEKPTTRPKREETTEPMTKATAKASNTKDLEWTFAPKKIHEYKGDGSCGPHKDLELNQEIFHWWVDLAAKHNVTYFLTCGTLLGAWRDGNIIPWDHDMDVLIAATDRIKLDPIRNMRPFRYDNKYRLILQEDWRLPYSKRRRIMCDGKEVSSYSCLCSFQEPFGRVIKRTNYIDIYDYTVADGIITDLSDYKKLYKVKDIFPLRKCKFMGIETFCPRDPYAVLKSIYGDHLVPSRKCQNKKWD